MKHLKDTDHTYMDMHQAAEYLGLTGPNAVRRTRRLLLRLEREEDMRLLIVTNQDSGKGRRYYTTPALLRQYMPELFAEHPTTAGALKELEKRLTDLVIQHRARNRELDDQLKSIRADNRDLGQQIKSLREATRDPKRQPIALSLVKDDSE